MNVEMAAYTSNHDDDDAEGKEEERFFCMYDDLMDSNAKQLGVKDG